jgi:hypothetical protein
LGSNAHASDAGPKELQTHTYTHTTHTETHTHTHTQTHMGMKSFRHILASQNVRTALT